MLRFDPSLVSTRALFPRATLAMFMVLIAWCVLIHALFQLDPPFLSNALFESNSCFHPMLVSTRPSLFSTEYIVFIQCMF